MSEAGRDSLFEVDLEVRDYECDLQGVVNNAVYLHYLEHARHLFLRSQGLDFAELARQGVNLVLTRAEIDYLRPLRSGDRFRVSSTLQRVSRRRFGFRQDIVRLPDGKAVAQGLAVGTAVDADGRPCWPEEVEALLSRCAGPLPVAVRRPAGG